MIYYVLFFVVGVIYGVLFCYVTMSIDKQIETHSLKEENNRLNEKIKDVTTKLIVFQTKLRGD